MKGPGSLGIYAAGVVRGLVRFKYVRSGSTGWYRG